MKSVADIQKQMARIAEHYGDDSPRTRRSDEAGDRYISNIYSTGQFKRDYTPKRKGDRQALLLASKRANYRKYSRSQYMGLSNG